mmetsp:Transcript_29661/g.73489  ORF Transcript_29661/g.73489 Transcript_29661/m.73489 type:complete len:122 (+) Transcript_29661:1081-1446(+)
MAVLNLEKGVSSKLRADVLARFRADTSGDAGVETPNRAMGTIFDNPLAVPQPSAAPRLHTPLLDPRVLAGPPPVHVDLTGANNANALLPGDVLPPGRLTLGVVPPAHTAGTTTADPSLAML